ncbi:amidohydrolase family protein [Kitasatospora mediocidica]|uniref:amidohydrolase family protein n=1 Tax=Kitasatospora mediocidica TaxID=58352 RepID=UPI000A06BD6C|nr:amidohydrolase family protein [Kitasatospora mediocidica]
MEAGLPFDAWRPAAPVGRTGAAGRSVPAHTIVLDHLGKPKPESGNQWSQAPRQVAKQPNTVCKLSGLATELAPDATPASALALLREVLDVFGPDRCHTGH